MIPGTLLAGGVVMQQTREQKIARAAEDAERMTDGALAREIVTQSEEHRRRAYLRELLWRWRDYTETERPWQRDPAHIAWWE